MGIKEKIRLIEESMDLDEGTVDIEDQLDIYDEWDSVSALSFIAMVGEKFNKTVSGNEIRNAKSIKDLIVLME